MAALPAGIVAFLLTDLAGSTHAWEDRPNAMRQVLEQHDEIIVRCVEGRGGALVEAGREGDSVLAVFQNTAAAANAALDIQRAVAAAEWPEGIGVRIRIALHAGEAQLRGGHYFGQALNRCARLLATCHPGQILMTKTVQEILVDEPPDGAELWDLGLHRLKDLKRPEHIFQLVDRERPARFPPIRSLPHELTNLPVQVTTFVGRQDELRKLRQLQRNARLLTLTGTGGCGKTRLGQELASELVSEQQDGVWFADLSPVMDPQLVARAVASGLELQEQVGRTPLETVILHCRDRQLVLLLDNCEHLIEACAELVNQLIKSCPGVRIIATSREPLRVPGETVWRVPPLSVPEATQLFLDRALASSPTYVVPETSLPAVARLSERLDGIPLAMELAAARVPMMPVDEILERLERGLTFLTGGDRTAATRQRTLQATMEWSHGLLQPAEQVLFRRLAVFAGSFTLAACEKVCTEPDLAQAQIVNLLGELVSKSLVVAVDGHCHLLDTIRGYASERLETANERAAMQRQHAEFFLRLAASRRPGELAKWLDMVEENHDNLRAAIMWATQSDPDLAADIASQLFAYWLMRAYITEARDSLEQLLRRLDPAGRRRSVALIESGAFAYVAGDFAAADQRLEEGLEGARREGDTMAVIRALFYRGVLESARGGADEAQQSLEEALRLSREIGSGEHEGEVLHQLGMAASVQGDPEQAATLLKRSLDVRRGSGRGDEAGMTLVFLAAVMFTRGEIDAARRMLHEALSIGRALRDRRSAWSLDVLACMTAMEGDLDRALRLAGAASAMFDATGQKPPERWHQFTSMFLEPARSELGPVRVNEIWEKGRKLDFEAALDYALQETKKEA